MSKTAYKLNDKVYTEEDIIEYASKANMTYNDYVSMMMAAGAVVVDPANNQPLFSKSKKSQTEVNEFEGIIRGPNLASGESLVDGNILNIRGQIIGTTDDRTVAQARAEQYDKKEDVLQRAQSFDPNFAVSPDDPIAKFVAEDEAGMFESGFFGDPDFDLSGILSGEKPFANDAYSLYYKNVTPDTKLPTDQYNRALYRIYGTTNSKKILAAQNKALLANRFDITKAEDYLTKSYKEQQELIRKSESVGGILDFFIDENPKTQLEQATKFFTTPSEEAALMIATLLSGGEDNLTDTASIDVNKAQITFDAGDYTVVYQFGKGTPGVAITHKESGLTETIDLQITPDVTEYFVDTKEQRQKLIKKNRNKLVDFVTSTITQETVDDIKLYNKEILGEWHTEYENNVKVKGAQLSDIKDEINEITFEPEKRTRATTTSFGVTSSTTYTVYPYKVELEQAKNQLIQQGNINPTEEEIKEKTRENLLEEKIRSAREQNAKDYYNRGDIEETTKLSMYKYSSFLQGELTEQNLEDLVVKQSVYHQYRENFIEEQQPGGDHNISETFLEIYESKEKVDISDHHYDLFGVKNPLEMPERERFQVPMVTLENGTVMPKAMFDKGNKLFEKTKTAYKQLLDFEEEIEPLFNEIKSDQAILDLTQRDYNDLRKFTTTLGHGFVKNILKGVYGLGNISSNIMTVGSGYEFVEQTEQIMKAEQEIRGLYQQDVEFGNAFSSIDNFGRFLSQEVANQVPIFAMIATGSPGIAALGLGSMQEQYTTMSLEDLRTGNVTSEWKKWAVSLGYGGAEVLFDRFLTLPVLKRGANLLSRGARREIVDNGMKAYWKTYGKRSLLYDPLLETASEGLTTITQNLITGRPITENLSHALFSGGMFGTALGHVPFYKGLVMSKFSDYDSYNGYRDNLKQIEGLEQIKANLETQIKRKGKNKDKKKRDKSNEALQSRIDLLNQQIESLNQDNQGILKDLEKKMGNMDEDWFNTYNDLTVEQEKLRIQAEAIKNDKTISSKQAEMELAMIKARFDDIQDVRQDMLKGENYGNKYGAFKNSTEQSDIDLKNELEDKVKFEYNKRGKSEPDEETLDNEVRILYNTKLINDDVKKLTGALKEGGTIAGVEVSGFENFQTTQEAVDFINNLENVSDAVKKSLIKEIEQGGHGATITMKDADGNIKGLLPFQVVENMAKDNRLETRTHELGHAIFRIAFNGGDFNTIEIAENILEYAKNQQKGLYAMLRMKTVAGANQTKTAEEIIVNFFELVAEGKIDLKAPKNKGLGAFVANLFQSKVDLNIKGETDAITFLIGLAKKIKAGTITEADIKQIREGNILKKVEATTKETVVDFSKAKAKQTLSVVQEEANVDGKFIKDKFNPEDKRIQSLLPGMINAQIINLNINRYLKEQGKKELEAQTIFELFARNDIAKFDGRGTLYGFINGRIKFAMKDAFKNNPIIVEDFNKADLDETMKRLEAEDIDTTPLDETLTDDATASDAKINVLALTNKESDIVKVIKPDGDFKQVTDTNIGKVGSVIFNIPANKISNPKANITTSTKIVDSKTGEVLTKKELKEGKKGIFSPSEAKNIQDFFSNINTTKKFIKILPKENVAKKDADINRLGENIDVSRETLGRSLGLPRRILEYFYQPKMENGKRVRSQGKTSQVPMWELKPEFSNLSDSELTAVAEQFQQDLGITKDGLTNVLPTAANRSKIGQLLKGAAVIMSQQASLSGAQRVKERKLRETKDTDAKAKIKQEIADITAGQADVAFSKKNKKSVGEVVAEAYGWNLGFFGTEIGIPPVPNKTAFRTNSKGKKVPYRTRDLDALIPGTDVTYGQLMNESLGNFFKSHPEWRDLLRNTLTGGLKAGWYQSTDKFDAVHKKTNKKQKYKSRFKYTVKKLLDPKVIEKLKDPNFKKDQDERLPMLYDFFKSVESHLKNNPQDVWVFESLLLDTGKHQNTFTRILAPFSFYPVDKNRNPIFNKKVVEEHTDPQNQIGKGMLWAAVNGDVDAMWSAVGQSYMQGAILEEHDPQGSLKSAMPSEYYEFTIPLLKSGKLKLPNGYASIIRLALSGPNNNSNVIDLNQYMLVGEQQTITEFFGVDTKADITPEIIAFQNETIVKVLTGQMEMSSAKKYFNSIVPVSNNVKNASKAQLIARVDNSKKSRGMTAWDFDDTLATTKSGVRATVPNPDGTPQPNRKVIFLAGGAGSGKSNVVKKLGLESQGFKIVNSDISLEWLKKNSGLPENMNDLTREQLSELGRLQAQSRKISKGKMMKYQGNADGVVVDGTGGSIKAMEKLVNEFKEKGYDVSMVFVETSLETALDRNRKRKERSLLDKIVEKNHAAVQGNKQGFKEMFGERFMEVKTDNLTQADPMPNDLMQQMNDFVSSYKKLRLDAEEFATQGAEILEQGGEFDFSEFNVVTEGARGPMFNKAMSRAQKYGTSDTYVLTARPPASALPIQQFLASQGLNIPLENITGLGNSTGEAEAEWMLEKFSEGYNNMYFADDAMQNVEAVKDVLDQLDIKSKVVQAKVDFSRKSKIVMDGILGDPKISKQKQDISINNVKNVNTLDKDGVYTDVQFSKKHRGEYENLISKNRPDLVKEGLVSQTVDQMFNLVNGLDIPVSKRRKYEQIMTKWLATSVMKLPEDNYKLQDSVELAEKNNLDVFSYKNPNEIIEQFAGKSKEKLTDPDTVDLFTKDESKTNDEYGITEYVVEETRESQAIVRKVIDTHWGPKSNPWCICSRDKNGSMESAWGNWERYSDGPKRIVFENGKLIAFYANSEYWDRMDNNTDAPVITRKKGNVTEKIELVPIGKGKVDEFVRERRTVSQDKNTVKTEYFATINMGEDTIVAGDYTIENRVNGQTVKKTEYNSKGVKYSEINYRNGKVVNNKNFIDGRLVAVNTFGRPFGDMSPEQIAKEKGDQIEGVGDIFASIVVGNKMAEVGFRIKENIGLEGFIKESTDGKIRLDLNKVAEADSKARIVVQGARPAFISDVDFSKKQDKDFNKILEQTTGIDAKKRFSDAQAKLRGKGFKFTGLIPPSAQDFAGLLYSFLAPGKLGEKQFAFFKENLIDPFARGINELNTSRQKSAEDYKNLLNKYPDVRKDLKKELDKFEGYEGVKFTVDQAVRVYLWTKAGFDVPGLSARDLKLLTDFVKSDSELMAFADAVGLISKKDRGYAEPSEYWLVENINSDLMSDGAIGEVRADFLADFIENKNQIFSKENLNKIEAIYGAKFREALEDVLFRMETGRNMPRGGGRLMQEYTSWINGSVGAIMFFNMRSALLQTISAVNYINWSDNNPLKAAAAFANQKQFWSDFVFLFNSDFLKQRRSGNRRGVNEAELSQAVAGKSSYEQSKAVIRYLLKIGFLPTQIADSFAIASGGASFYRNRVNSYLKKGMSRADAESKAFLDFQETTEVSQQSARPDLISQQQANPLGRLILAFANTPMQYGRIMDKAFRDIVNNRGDFKTNTSKIIYYGVIQSVIFSALQTALFALIGSEEEEKDELLDKKTDRILNNMLDTFLTTFGFGGKAISTAKNTAMEYLKQRDKDLDDSFMTKSDHAYTLLQALSFSPPISSKLRKVYQSIQTEKFNRDIIKERGFKLDNPVWGALGNIIEGTTNIPLGRLSNKMLNIDNALDSRNQTWQRLALIMGWNTWDLGIKDHDIEALDADIKERKKIQKEQEKIKKKYEEKKTKLMEKYPDLDEEQIDIKIQSEKYYPLRKYEQVELLKKLDLSDKEIKQLKTESDRAEKINELYKDNEKLIDSYLKESESKSKEDKDKEQEASKPKKQKPTREKQLFKLNKKQQVSLLFELGLKERVIYSLKNEKDRVNKILELEKKSK